MGLQRCQHHSGELDGNTEYGGDGKDAEVPHRNDGSISGMAGAKTGTAAGDALLAALAGGAGGDGPIELDTALLYSPVSTADNASRTPAASEPDTGCRHTASMVSRWVDSLPF